MTHLISNSQLLAVLSGGKAPYFWWRGIVQKTAKLVAVRRCGVWLQAFGDIHPRLCEGSLWGHTLTSLTGQLEHPQETPSEAVRSGKKRPTQWESPLKANRNVTTTGKPITPQFRFVTPIQQTVTKKTVSASSPVNSSAQAVFQMKAQAGHLLLSRLTEGEPVFDRTRQVQIKSFLVQDKKNKALFPSDYGDSTTQQDLLNRLIQRAEKVSRTDRQPNMARTTNLARNNGQILDYSPSLQEQWSTPLDGISVSLELLNQSFSAEEKSSAAFSLSNYGDSATEQKNWLTRLAQKTGISNVIQKQPNTAGTIKITQNKAQILDQSPTLREQWAMPLDGMSASLELLNRLVQDNFSDRANNSERAQQHQPQSLSKSFTSQPFLKPDRLSAEWQGESVSGSNKSEQQWIGSTFFAPKFSVNGQLGYGGSEIKSSVPTIPPNVTISMPDLLSPQQADTQPLPVAAATVRQGARAEELKATDDLDSLATKINQILNEQARRHGIDV